MYFGSQEMDPTKPIFVRTSAVVLVDRCLFLCNQNIDPMVVYAVATLGCAGESSRCFDQIMPFSSQIIFRFGISCWPCHWLLLLETGASENHETHRGARSAIP